MLPYNTIYRIHGSYDDRSFKILSDESSEVSIWITSRFRLVSLVDTSEQVQRRDSGAFRRVFFVQAVARQKIVPFRGKECDTHRIHGAAILMVTFTINIPPLC